MPQVLIIEDDRDVRDTLYDAFVSRGVSCWTVENGLEAIKYLDTAEVKVIVSDYRMPLMNGLDLMQHLASSPLKHIPVILMSSEPVSEFRDGALHLGAVAVVQKPYNMGELIELVLRVMRQSEDGP